MIQARRKIVKVNQQEHRYSLPFCRGVTDNQSVDYWEGACPASQVGILSGVICRMKSLGYDY